MSIEHQSIVEMTGETIPPVIIIGMHRSGTSLVSLLLEECGVFFGWDKDEHNESLFFQAVNENLFRQGEVDWDNPEKLQSTLQDPKSLHLAQQYVINLLEYYQKRDQEVDGSLSSMWGWKDPRNSFTLPVWQSIFPKSKVIHVIRNGIDVAVSLWRRETTRRFGQNDPHYSRRCQTLPGCLDLWQSYVEAGRFFCGKDQTLTVFFEDLLLQPQLVISRILEFLEIGEQVFPHREVALIETKRRFAYLRDDQSKEFYRYGEKNELIRELYGDADGYDRLIGEYGELLNNLTTEQINQ